jgi:putative transcriptional regulator
MSEKRTIRVTLDISKKPVPKGKTDWARLRAMTEAEARVAALADRDNQPLTPAELARLEPIPDIRAIREGLGLSQRDFATRFHLSLATVRDWEQGRYQPDQAARTLLRLIAREPALVERTLRRAVTPGRER